MRYLFEGFELDDDLFELRDAAGLAIPLRRQAVDILLLLLRARDRVVAKEEIVDAVWSGAAISDTALPQAVRAIRRALGDEREGARFIQTLRGRGYRFVAEVKERAANQAGTADALVGREAALSRLEEMLAEADGGRGGVALVSADAGVGRTRTAMAVVTLARTRGFSAHVVRCDAELRAPELSPWTQLGRAALGAQAPELTFDGATRSLADAARATPLLLVLDDVDQADVASLLLLKRAAHALHDARVLVLATYRDASLVSGSPLARTVGALVREKPSRHVSLAPLAEADVARVATAALGATPDTALLARLMEKTSGNPSLLAQLLHVMRSGPNADASTSRLLAEGETREAIAVPLNDLSPECRAMLDAAAVLGQAFSLSVLAAVVGAEPAGVLERIDEAVEARILARDDARFRFVHALLRDVVYAKLRASRRVALHDRAAQALEAAGDAAGALQHRERVRALLGPS